MDQKIVNKLERELEKAIAEVVVVRLGLKSLPLLPPRPTIQMMAKAAVAVYRGRWKPGECLEGAYSIYPRTLLLSQEVFQVVQPSSR